MKKKKTLKKVLIAIGIVIIIIALGALGLYLKLRSELKTMTQIETGKITDDVYAIKDSFVNMFIVQDSNQYVAIDAGNDEETIAAELKKLNIDPEKVMAVLLTHTDRDHVVALGLFKNAKVYFSKPEEQMINGQKSKFLWFGNSISAKEYTLLDDQQILNIGNIKVQCILTTGHTSGSMCYLVNDKYLFTGDAISLNAGKVDKANKFFSMEPETANKSIVNITKLPDAEYIFTSHWGYTDDYKNAVKGWKPE
jgi:hydroxyacylglutathione hydrolase